MKIENVELEYNRWCRSQKIKCLLENEDLDYSHGMWLKNYKHKINTLEELGPLLKIFQNKNG